MSGEGEVALAPQTEEETVLKVPERVASDFQGAEVAFCQQAEVDLSLKPKMLAGLH